MVSFLENFPPIIQALWGTGFTYLMTALGALGVFLGRELDKRLLNGMMGFAAGVMIAASYFSLLAPAIELSADLPGPIWLPAVGGFLLGGGFLWGVDKLLPHLHVGDDQPEGLRTTWQRNILLVFAITLHNIPEGLAVGVAFGAANAGLSGASLT
ncbi:MAG TPA: ZIP family metal transporter, partial [Anaerolineaceae bacterium]|nr:ZIP family metal transporter [Anaerolineaceae bacterium]